MFIVNHHIFTYNDKEYVIDVENMTAAAIDDATAAALRNITADANFHLEPDIKMNLTNLGLILEEEPEEKLENEEEIFRISHIALFITQECNLNCVYCYGVGGNYGSSGHITSFTARKAVDWLIEQSGEIRELNISFFGGEPLMNFPVIKEIVDYADKMAPKKEKEFTFGITTNLTLLDEGKLSFLKENKITTNVSFDGAKEIQDKQRPFKDGKGSSYDATIPRINELLSIIPDAYCRATLVGDTDPVNVREALSEIGFLNIVMTCASPSLLKRTRKGGHRNIAAMLRMLQSDAELFLKNVRNKNADNLHKQEKSTGFLLGVLDIFLYGYKRHFPCGAGKSYVAVSNLGDVFLCHRFVGTKEYKLGSVFKRKLIRKPYLKSPLKTIEKCSECFAKYICAGRCYYDNKASTGSVFAPSEDNCKMIERTMELIAYVTANLSSEDKDYLVKEKLISAKPINKDEVIDGIRRKRQKIMSEIEELGLGEKELKEIEDELSL